MRTPKKEPDPRGKGKPKTPLVLQAFEKIEEKIVTMEFAPGMKLEEQQLTNALNLGRTPVREALKMLMAEGLIVSYGSNATYVKDLTLKSAKDLFLMLYSLGDVIFALADPGDDFRPIIEELEVLNAQMDKSLEKGDVPRFARLNAGFHKTLAGIARNTYLDELVRRLYREEIRTAYALSLSLGKVKGAPYLEYYEQIQKQHRQLIGFLKVPDFEKLKAAYKNHLVFGQKRVSAYFAGSVAEKKRIITS